MSTTLSSNTPQTTRTHAGPSFAESKPRPADHDDHLEDHYQDRAKVAADKGPPQPDFDAAERERQEKQSHTSSQDAAQYPEQIHAGRAGLGPEYGTKNHVVRAAFAPVMVDREHSIDRG